MGDLAELAAEYISLKTKNAGLLGAVLNAEAQRAELLTLCDDILADGFNETARMSWASQFVARLAAIKAKGE